MSGIAGFAGHGLTGDAQMRVAAMAQAMAYRGPDGIAYWQGQGMALACLHLCTTPESLSERMPLRGCDGQLILVADVRLDNRAELAAALGLPLAVAVPPGDGALLLAAFRRWGEHCLSWLEGDFAFALWQVTERRLFMARDRVGHKPLFYRHGHDGLAFASDIAALWAHDGCRPPLNRGVLAERMAAEWNSSHETLWQGIVRLPPAHSLVFEAGRLTLRQYWTPDLGSVLEYRQDQDYVEHYAELLRDQVRRQSRSSFPLACEVSGGLDSSAVFAVAAGLQAGGCFPAPALQGMTLDCSEDPDADEIAYVRELSRYLGLPIQEVLPHYPDTAWYLQRMQKSGEFPEFPNNAMLIHLLEKASTAGCRAILNGMGGDEWLWGSRRYYEEELVARRWQQLLHCLWADLKVFGPVAPWWLLRQGMLRRLPGPVYGMLRQLRRSLRREDAWAGKPWLSPATHALLAARHREAPALRWARAGQEEPVTFLYDNCRVWVLELGERMYAGHGMEGRSPMNSARMIQFCLSLPERMKMRGLAHKYVHVEACRGLLPESIRTRRSKAEFSTPGIRQLDATAAFFRDGVQGPARDWLDLTKLQELYKAFEDEPRHAWRNAWLWHAYLSAAVLDSHGADGQNSV